MSASLWAGRNLLVKFRCSPLTFIYWKAILHCNTHVQHAARRTSMHCVGNWRGPTKFQKFLLKQICTFFLCNFLWPTHWAWKGVSYQRQQMAASCNSCNTPTLADAVSPLWQVYLLANFPHRINWTTVPLAFAVVVDKVSAPLTPWHRDTATLRHSC